VIDPFAGFILWGRPHDETVAQRFVAIIGRRWGVQPIVARAGNALILQSRARPHIESSHGFTVADARLDNRDQALWSLGVDPGASDAAIIARALEPGGHFGAADLLGAFAAAKWDERTRTLVLIRDCLGRRPLFFHHGNGLTVFASLLPDLLVLPEVPRRLDEEMLARHLALDNNVAERTLYRDIFRVPSRTCATISADRVVLQPYWSPRSDAVPHGRSDADFIACGRELFDRAVARCLRDTPRVALYASGGLDSSAVAATAIRLGHADVTCYTGIPPHDLNLDTSRSHYWTEQPKIEALVRHCPGLKVRFVAPRGIHAWLLDYERVFRVQGLPNFSPGGRGWFGAIENEIVADGHTVALWGTFGNIGLSWSGSYVLVELARQGRLIALFREATALARQRRSNAPLLIAGQLLASAPRVVQRAITSLRGRDPYDVSGFSLLRQSAIARLNLKKRWRQNGFDPKFRRAGPPAKWRAGLMFDHMQSSREAELMRHFSLGLEPRDPFADRELLEFCLTVPETLYCRNGVRRWFARQILADRLPPEIVGEQRRGLQEPNWFEQLTARKPAIGEEIAAIEHSALASELIDVPRLKQLYREWPADAPTADTPGTEYQCALDRAVHVAQFIRWAENGQL